MADRSPAPDTPELRERWGGFEFSEAWAAKADGAIARYPQGRLRSAVCAVTGLALVAATASAAEPAGNFAKTAADVANSIYAGQDVAPLGVPPLSEPERAELSKLKGCKPAIVGQRSKNLVMFDWTCNGSAKPVTTTIMRFKDDGSMFGFAVQPARASFAPTAQGLALASVPERSRTVNDFAKALKDGGDLSLGGLIPLTPLQLSQLAVCQGRRTSTYPEADATLVVCQKRSTPGTGDFGAKVHFNGQDLPIGVRVEPSLIRQEIFTTVEPISTREARTFYKNQQTVTVLLSTIAKGTTLPAAILQRSRPELPAALAAVTGCKGRSEQLMDGSYGVNWDCAKVGRPRAAMVVHLRDGEVDRIVPATVRREEMSQ